MADPLPFDPIAEAQHQWEHHWGEDPNGSMVAVTSIMRVQQILIARLTRLLKPWQLTFPRYEALMLLYYSRAGALPLGKMGARLQVHPTSITNTMDGLQRLGYATRSRHDSDRRKWLAQITDHGREVARESTAAVNAAHFGTEPLTARQLTELFEVLRAVRIDEGDFAP